MRATRRLEEKTAPPGSFHSEGGHLAVSDLRCPFQITIENARLGTSDALRKFASFNASHIGRLNAHL